MIAEAFGTSPARSACLPFAKEPLDRPPPNPFDSVENAHQYVRLLVEAIAEAKSEIAADLDANGHAQSERRVAALQLVQFKLDKLERHLQSSSRLLNDLRSLRRLLFGERPEDERTEVETESAAAEKDSAA